MPLTQKRDRTSTAGGLLALALWSTSIGVSRSLTESLGPVRAAALMYGLAGLVGSIRYALDREAWRQVRALPRSYLCICGGLFALYGAAFFLAVGLARYRHQVMAVGVINYLWPTLTLVLAIPILGRRANLAIVPGALLATGGVVLATAGDLGAMGQGDGLAGGRGAAACGLALLAAVTWGLYSNLGRRLAGGAPGNAVPLFMLLTGAILLGADVVMAAGVGAGAGVGSTTTQATASATTQATAPVMTLATTGAAGDGSGAVTWHSLTATAGPLAFAVLLPGLMAYSLWDRGVRCGNVILLSVASYFVPLLSTLITGLYLGVAPGAALWAASVLVAAGAMLSYLAFLRPGKGTGGTGGTGADQK